MPFLFGNTEMKLVVHPDSARVSQVDLCQRLVSHLGEDYAPTHLVLDLNDYVGDSSVLDEFRDIAFSWNQNCPIERVPPYLQEVMSDLACTHLVWLSHEVLRYTESLFVWVLAHELRHFYQLKQGFQPDCIRRRINELRRKPEFISLPPSVFDPAEIDSELCGLREASAMFGAARLDGLQLPRCPYPAYVKFLQELESSSA